MDIQFMTVFCQTNEKRIKTVLSFHGLPDEVFLIS